MAESPSASRMRAIASRQRYGFCGSAVESSSSSARRRWSAAAARSFLSHETRLSATCMSGTPRRPGPSPAASSRARSMARSAPSSRPRVSSRSASVMWCRTRRRSGRPSAALGGDRVAAVGGLQVAHRPGSETGQRRRGRRGRLSSFAARAMVRSAWVIVATGSPWLRASAARYISIDAGTRASSSRSSTTSSSSGSASCRSMSCNRSSTPSNSLLDIRPPTRPRARTGRFRSTSSGMTSAQPRNTASRRTRASSGIASSASSAARSTSPAASACRTAGSGSPASSYQLPARRCSPATRSGCSASRCARRTSANRWW